jgi:hypothetical protein
MFSGTKLAPSRAEPTDMVQSVPQNLKWLKVAVIGMGIAIVLGTGVVAITILLRIFHHPDVAPVPAHFDVALPPGAQILESSSDAGRLLLRLKIAESEEIRIFDLSTGREIARIGLGPVP